MLVRKKIRKQNTDKSVKNKFFIRKTKTADKKNKFQNKFSFFLNSLININDAYELISLVETVRKL